MRRARRCKDVPASTGDDEVFLEGPHLIGEALAAGLELTSVLATEEFLRRAEAQTLVEQLPAAPQPVLPQLLAELADSDSPRGIVALARIPRPGIAALPRHANGVYVFVDGVQDPGNLGALARVAEASGVVGLGLGPGTAHPNHPRALRASAGSLLRLPVALRTTPQRLQEHLQPVTPTWIALVPRGGQDFQRPLPASAVVVAVGAEGAGLSADALQLAHDLRTIPLAPPVESLNTTVAAALLLFELRRQRAR